MLSSPAGTLLGCGVSKGKSPSLGVRDEGLGALCGFRALQQSLCLQHIHRGLGAVGAPCPSNAWSRRGKRPSLHPASSLLIAAGLWHPKTQNPQPWGSAQSQGCVNIAHAHRRPTPCSSRCFPVEVRNAAWSGCLPFPLLLKAWPYPFSPALPLASGRWNCGHRKCVCVEEKLLFYL